MKKRLIAIATSVLVVAGIGTALFFNLRDTQDLPCRFVAEFIALSYNADADSIEEVLQAQQGYFEKTYGEYVAMNPQLDLAGFINTQQRMEVAAQPSLRAQKNALGNIVVYAEFVVRFTDIYIPEGFEMPVALRFDLLRLGYGEYEISYIAG